MIVAVSPDAGFSPAPLLLLALSTYTALYLVRWRQVRTQVGPRGARVRHLVSFAAGMSTLAVALVSPVDRLAEQFAVLS